MVDVATVSWLFTSRYSHLFALAYNRVAKYVVVAEYTIGEYLRDIYAVGAVAHLFGSGEVALRVFEGAESPVSYAELCGNREGRGRLGA